jgi:hypothetical protein
MTDPPPYVTYTSISHIRFPDLVNLDNADICGIINFIGIRAKETLGDHAL